MGQGGAQQEGEEEEEDIYGGVGQPHQDARGSRGDEDDDIYGGVGAAPHQAAGYDEAEEDDLYTDIVPGLAQVDGVRHISLFKPLGRSLLPYASLCAFQLLYNVVHGR
jgi:hypothetical protein